MGFDTSFHPVDTRLYHERLFPYIRGEGEIDDLVANAVRIAKVRFRANAWGLGTSKFGRQDPKTGISPVPAQFDAWLHVWGRPFFITCEAPADVSEAIDRYLAAEPEDVDTIATDMLRLLDPALVGRVQPNTDGTLPSDERLAQSIRRDLDTLHDLDLARENGETFTANDGEELDPSETLVREMPWLLLRFAAHLRPGWMSRGYTWPTHLFREAGLLDNQMIASAEELYAPWDEDLPDLLDELPDTISGNYEVGGYVNPSDVPTFLAEVRRHRSALLAHSNETDLRKLEECLDDAARLGMGFMEATEIYSGIQGIMN